MHVAFHALAHLYKMPTYQSEGASGLDLYAAEDALLIPHEPHVVATGFAMEIPSGYEAQIRPRSGLALRHAITLPNSPGTIDCDYRGEIKVILLNLGREPYAVKRGDRIAQMVFAPVTRVTLTDVGNLSDTARASGGFGSTGLRDTTS